MNGKNCCVLRRIERRNNGNPHSRFEATKMHWMCERDIHDEQGC